MNTLSFPKKETSVTLPNDYTKITNYRTYSTSFMIRDFQGPLIRVLNEFPFINIKSFNGFKVCGKAFYIKSLKI